jgi:S-DNA-T family DNA segregation ATPase FtsK/SpoIIIE
VELSLFRGIPHLYAPIVQDAKMAPGVLKKLVKEMEERYKILSAASARNIVDYNKSSETIMPYIVVIVDELADLMLVGAREVEESIVRLAQLARGVGIHLVLATQRPSVNVITGVIKANMPSRIAFQVASKVDSRVILDVDGADKLLGRGDMLMNPAGASKPFRGQGALLSVSEIEAIASFLRAQGEPEYQTAAAAGQAEPAEEFGSEEDAELFYNALKMVVTLKKASTGLLKGALRISDGKATYLISQLENKQLIGPSQGSKPRDIFFDRIEEILSKRPGGGATQ